ncbi:porin [Burkholderia ubonensis]|uniref:porin n=1 Tax=Burkholderia ubonensis TaxID=101571 RepID=UPI0009B3BF09|nr:porin [Burkholderia ubonensis]
MSSKQDNTNSFTKEEGVIHLGGIDALVRLALDQVRADARRGLKTGMFVSGYRGSPVGMLDAAFIKQQRLLLENHIHFVDGIYEDLAATAVWGTQMLHTVGKQKFDGVTGMWYGKAPGVDRSGDALKQANYTGIGKNGAVLAVVGDDPSCKSSSLCSQSEPMLFHVGMPSLYPGNVQEILDLGLHGYQLPGGPFAKLGSPLGTFDYTRISGGEATSNAVKFTSRHYGGFSFGAMYGFSNIAGDTGSNNLNSFGASYDDGPFRLDAAYTYSKEDGIDNGHAGIRNFGVGGRYDFGKFAIDYLYVNTRNIFTGAHVDSYEVGGLYKFAVDFFLYANYIYAKGNEQLTNNHSNQAGITLDYLLSKRTDVYFSAIYQRASGGSDNFASVNGTFATSSSPNQTVLRLGVRTLF